MTEAESILDRAIGMVDGGFPPSPIGILAHISDPDGKKADAQANRRVQVGLERGMVPPESLGHTKALLALDSVAREEGAKNIVVWWSEGRKTREQVVALFKEALFNVQIGG